MLSERDLPLRIIGNNAFFDFLGPQDEPWLRMLLRQMQRFEGRRWRELAECLAEPLPCEAPYYKRRSATRVLARLWRRERVAAVPPRQARARLFPAAVTSDAPAPEVIADVAASFAVTAEALTESLFADLPGECRVRAPAAIPDPTEIALRTNLAIAQAVLMRACRVDLRVTGAARPIVRLAKLQGLLCVVRQDSPTAEPLLEISGPFSLFRHTLLYGRSLAALLPHLAWTSRFELRAGASLHGRVADFVLESGAPIFPLPIVASPLSSSPVSPGASPSPFDSRLEERFARDFEKAAPDWHVIREPEAVRAGNTLIFPDFLLQHRIHQERRVLVEIVGFWTPDYLANKLRHLRQACIENLLVCLDEDRACADEELPPSWPVVRFRRRVDAEAVLRQVDAMTMTARRCSAPLTAAIVAARR